MGFYIETGANKGKVRWLVKQGARVIPPPREYDPPKGETLLAVIDNGMFEAAIVIYDEFEFQCVQSEIGGRPITYLTLPTATAKQLCPFFPAPPEKEKGNPDGR